MFLNLVLIFFSMKIALCAAKYVIKILILVMWWMEIQMKKLIWQLYTSFKSKYNLTSNGCNK